MDTLKIVAAQRSDLSLVQALAHAIWHRHYPGIITVAQIEYMLARGYSDAALARFLEEPGAGLAIADVDARPVGFAAWYRADEPRTSKLDKLYVLPEMHGRGIGRRLVEHVEASARADGSAALVLSVNKHNAGAIAAYRRWGFVLRESVVIDIGEGYVMDDYIMAKPIPSA